MEPPSALWPGRPAHRQGPQLDPTQQAQALDTRQGGNGLTPQAPPLGESPGTSLADSLALPGPRLLG